MLNEERNVNVLELSNIDRKINFLVQGELVKQAKKNGNATMETEGSFVFFDQSARQDNPLGDQKSVSCPLRSAFSRVSLILSLIFDLQDYSSFLYLLRIEPTFLAKAVMEIPYAEMDFMVQCLTFSLFPDLFQAREELYLLELITHIINNQVEVSTEPTDVLRQNSIVTKLLNGYTKYGSRSN